MLIFFFSQNLNSVENKILIKIDQELITSIDIFNQSRYLSALNKDINSFDQDKIFEIAKNLIIKEKIKKLALEKEGISIEIQEEILNRFIRSSFKSNKINNLEDYKEFLNSLNLDFEYMKKKLMIDILWNNLIFEKFSDKIKINKSKLEKEVLDIKNKNLTSYLLHEIMFNASNKDEIDKKYKMIQKNIDDQGFKKTALIYSISDSSSNGGYIGWVNENSLNKKISETLKKLKKGENSKPILIPGGFLILKIQDKKLIERDVDLEKELNNLIQNKRNQQLNEYSNIYFNKLKKDLIINEL